MALYRPQAGGFEESMKQVVEVDGTTLVAVVSKQLGRELNPAQITVRYHCVDSRNDWLTHVVCVDGCAVGFTNASPHELIGDYLAYTPRNQA